MEEEGGDKGGQQGITAVRGKVLERWATSWVYCHGRVKCRLLLLICNIEVSIRAALGMGIASMPVVAWYVRLVPELLCSTSALVADLPVRCVVPTEAAMCFVVTFVRV